MSKKINIKPLGDRAIIRPLVAESKTATGIFIPDTASKEKSGQGEVVALGQGENIKKSGLKVGDKVLFAKYSPEEIKFEGEEYLVLSESSILAILG